MTHLFKFKFDFIDYIASEPKPLDDFKTLPVQVLGFLNDSEVITVVSKDGINEQLLATSINDSKSRALLDNKRVIFKMA